MKQLAKQDPRIDQIIEAEKRRQRDHLELIASENYVSEAVLEAQGSILTNKYAEGYSAKRYYGGCEYIDQIETLAIERLCRLFDARFANVQPHSGTQANMAVYRALLQHGDVVLGMALDCGGHLSHGHHLSFSGIDYQIVAYGVDPQSECIDYDEVERLAKLHHPKMIIAGASAYPRAIDFARFRAIADQVGAYLMVDMAHIAGLVAAGLHQNPLPYAHVVTSTTHKTLRGPRGGIILTNEEDIAKKLDRSVFPGVQGGPLMHVIAAKAVAFGEALQPDFRTYQKQVIKNAQALAQALQDRGYRLVSGGTDNHLLLVDVKTKTGLSGKEAEERLGSVGITVNKNTIPYDPEKPFITSGIRLGTPALTSRGMKENDMIQIAAWIDEALTMNEAQDLHQIAAKVEAFALQFPLREE